MIVYRELVHQVSSQEREVGHQWTHLNTKFFLAKTFLDMYCYTTLYIQYKNNFSHVRDHDNDDDEATSRFLLEQRL